MPHAHLARLQSLKTLPQLTAYLRDELDWPIEPDDAEDITFDYTPAELGLDEKAAVRIKEIKQLRPLAAKQPWGIFFVNFEKKRLPVAVMRLILRALVLKKRASASNAERQAWQPHDLLFISAYGEDTDRAITFAHFVENPGNHLAELRVLGWDDDDTPLHMDYVAKMLHEKLRWNDKLAAHPDAWRKQWSDAFLIRHRFVITKSEELAAALATLARRIRSRVGTVLRSEDGSGQMRKLQTAFRTGLIHDLDDAGFADMFAQTVTYGLFSLACRRTHPGEGTAFVKDDLPGYFTSPFLKEMLGVFLGIKSRKGKIDFDELGVSDVTDLLTSPDTHMEVVLADFNNKTRGEDPVIHFYEHFLNAYNKQLKIQRGVFYTPQPVVSYIVRSVHQLLQTEFGLADGLADTTTWGAMLKKHPDLKLPPLTDEPGEKRTISPDEPFVQILDPATGTATFLVEVIDVIHRHLSAQWKKGGLAALPLLPHSSEPAPAASAHAPGHLEHRPPGAEGLPHGAEGLPHGTEGLPHGVEGLPHGAERLPHGVERLPHGVAGLPPGAQTVPRPVETSSRGSFSTFPEYWNAYVPRALLPRLHAFELMMAPYAIAHMKIGLKLAETGYRFGTEERARIYLTNALEPKVQQLPQIGFDALAHEAAAVNEIKWYKRFTVVIGNPPYSGHSANDSAWAEQLLKEYYSVDGAPLGERNPKWLQDDYVKFIRLGQELMRRSGVGVFGFITNHGYIDNPTFRGMRQSLLRDFTRFHALDLHGNTKKEERSPDGSADGNVFDIQQGVAVLVATKTSHGEHSSSHCDLFGTREVKYKALAIASVSTLDWNQLAPSSPFYLLHPQNIDVRAEYDAYVRITDVLPVNVLGFQTHRDHFAIDSTEAGMRERIGLFRAKELSDAAAKERFEIKDADGWNVHEARTKLRADRNWEAHFTKCLYRPFDTRWCYFNGVAMDRPRRELLNHVVHRENICLLVPRQIGVLPWQHVCVSRLVAESCVVSTKTKEQNYNFPLWTFPESDGLAFSTERRLNLAPSIIRGLGDALGLQIHKQTGLPAGLTPEDIFHYAYAVFHSPGYRSRYAEFLKIDFPRLPLTGNLELFRALARLGGALTALHLLESPQLAQPITEYIGGRSPEVEKPTWSNNTVWVDKAQTTGFRGVPEAVWNFHIGGYQVCAKWLKDRKGRTLSAEDIAHYQKIVVALSETIRLMAEIDEVIEKHGGWPLK